MKLRFRIVKYKLFLNKDYFNPILYFEKGKNISKYLLQEH